MTDYWKNICAIQRRQTEKGIKHYGQRLEENTTMSMLENLDAISEEAIDMLMYLEHLKERLRCLEDDGK